MVLSYVPGSVVFCSAGIGRSARAVRLSRCRPGVVLDLWIRMIRTCARFILTVFAVKIDDLEITSSLALLCSWYIKTVKKKFYSTNKEHLFPNNFHQRHSKEFSPAIKKKYRTESIDTPRVSPAVSHGQQKLRTPTIFSRRFLRTKKPRICRTYSAAVSVVNIGDLEITTKSGFTLFVVYKKHVE
jgi:hypothetical protein